MIVFGAPLASVWPSIAMRMPGQALAAPANISSVSKLTLSSAALSVAKLICPAFVILLRFSWQAFTAGDGAGTGGWLSWRGCDLGGRLGPRWPGARTRPARWCWAPREAVARARPALEVGLQREAAAQVRPAPSVPPLRRGCRCSQFRALDRRRHSLFGARVDAWCRDGRLWRLGLFRGVGRRWRYGRRLTRCGWCWSGRLRRLGRGSRHGSDPRQRLRRGWRNRLAQEPLPHAPGPDRRA